MQKELSKKKRRALNVFHSLLPSQRLHGAQVSNKGCSGSHSFRKALFEFEETNNVNKHRPSDKSTAPCLARFFLSTLIVLKAY